MNLNTFHKRIAAPIAEQPQSSSLVALSSMSRRHSNKTTEITLTSTTLPSSTMAILHDQPPQYAGLSKTSQQCIEKLMTHQAEAVDLYVHLYFAAVLVDSY